MGSYRRAYESEGVDITHFYFSENVIGLYLTDTAVFEMNALFARQKLPVRMGPAVTLGNQTIKRQGRSFAIGMYIFDDTQEPKNGSSSLEDALDVLQSQIITDLTALAFEKKE